MEKLERFKYIIMDVLNFFLILGTFILSILTYITTRYINKKDINKNEIKKIKWIIATLLDKVEGKKEKGIYEFILSEEELDALSDDIVNSIRVLWYYDKKLCNDIRKICTLNDIKDINETIALLDKILKYIERYY